MFLPTARASNLLMFSISLLVQRFGITWPSRSHGRRDLMKISRSRLVPNAFALRHTPCDQIQAVRICLIFAITELRQPDENQQVSICPHHLRAAPGCLRSGGCWFETVWPSRSRSCGNLWKTSRSLCFVASVSTAKGVCETNRSNRPVENPQVSALSFVWPNRSVDDWPPLNAMGQPGCGQRARNSYQKEWPDTSFVVSRESPRLGLGVREFVQSSYRNRLY